jgi:hypothetical protein
LFLVGGALVAAHLDSLGSIAMTAGFGFGLVALFKWATTPPVGRKVAIIGAVTVGLFVLVLIGLGSVGNH